MIRRPPRSTQSRSSAASDVYKRQLPSEHHRVPLPRRLRPLQHRDRRRVPALSEIHRNEIPVLLSSCATRLRLVHPSAARTWSFYILLVTFMGISPGGARESSPWREPWEQTRTARSPGGAKEPFHGDSPIAGHEGPSYAPTGLARLWAGPTGLTPWAIF